MAVSSIVETAKANELDPQKYLQFLLDKRPSSEMTDEVLDQLLPWSSEAKAACGKKQSETLAFPTASNRLSEILLGNAPKLSAYSLLKKEPIARLLLGTILISGTF